LPRFHPACRIAVKQLGARRLVADPEKAIFVRGPDSVVRALAAASAVDWAVHFLSVSENKLWKKSFAYLKKKTQWLLQKRRKIW
jgi:hypothetical protein